jgi:hypothetical protein
MAEINYLRPGELAVTLQKTSVHFFFDLKDV